MLLQLRIQNYAIIEDVEVLFKNGLQVITGETGAGKSILIDALGIALGDRTDTTVLGDKSKKCVVEASFAAADNELLQKKLQEHGLDGDSEVLFRREISTTGKSRAFINDTPVNLTVLKEAADTLIDLHRQFDTQELSSREFQRQALDAMADNQKLYLDYIQDFRLWHQATQHLAQLQEQMKSMQAEYDYRHFLWNELADADFKENELELAEEELKLLANAENIKSVFERGIEHLTAGDQPLLSTLKHFINQVDGLRMEHFKPLTERLQAAYIELKDILGEIEHISNTVGIENERIDYLQQRLDIGNRLLKKHQMLHTNDLRSLQIELSKQLALVQSGSEALDALDKEIESQRQKLEESGLQLRNGRKGVLLRFQKMVDEQLHQMGMPGAIFSISLKDLPTPSPSGLDDIQFLFDGNNTGQLEPLGKIASGGELSRLMLSIKSLIAKNINLPVLVFDEIDTGIGGEAAKQVGVILQQLAQSIQVIVITHQPQIASKAANHFFVSKQLTNGLVKTQIEELPLNMRVTVLAEMLDGKGFSKEAAATALQMIKATT